MSPAPENRRRLIGPLPLRLASMTRAELTEERHAANDAIQAAYWRFTRTSSPRVPPPGGALYDRRAWADEALARVRDAERALQQTAIESSSPSEPLEVLRGRLEATRALGRIARARASMRMDLTALAACVVVGVEHEQAERALMLAVAS